jgi:hypothetical protein
MLLLWNIYNPSECLRTLHFILPLEDISSVYETLYFHNNIGIKLIEEKGGGFMHLQYNLIGIYNPKNLTDEPTYLPP